MRGVWRSTRRQFVGGAVAGSVAFWSGNGRAAGVEPLREVGYEQVSVRGSRQVAQRRNVAGVLMGLDPESLLRPYREMAGRAGAGASLGGWYEYRADYDPHHGEAGLAPGSTLGQWTSALSRMYAASRFGGAAGEAEMSERVVSLHGKLKEAISASYFEKTRFAGYSFDKLVCGLMDGHRLAGDGAAFETLDVVRAAAIKVLPGHAVDRDTQWKAGADGSWMWDETYTLPENLLLVSGMGAGEVYRRMAEDYLLDRSYFEPLSRGVNVLGDKHAYSYVNALCSAMQAYFINGSAMHLEAARNGFAFLEAQSYSTGGWGPDELLRKPGYNEVARSLGVSHNGFETACGSYAHIKLTRYLLRATRDGHYGDSMERVMLNTVMGALPLQADGRSFYNSDYHWAGKKIYSVHRWPCCSGTFPQAVSDYGINSYLVEEVALWVNLYQESEVRCSVGGTDVAVAQDGHYLEEGKARLQLRCGRAATFALKLRVPAWARGNVTCRVNGKSTSATITKGFMTLGRTWRTGDEVEMEFAMALRLEALPADGATGNAEIVSLCRGPLVLFAMREAGDLGPLTFREEALLKAERTGPLEWKAVSAAGLRRFVPFWDVGDGEYSTYVKLG